MLPPETTHTTLPSPALPARAEATEHDPAPSAITRLRSINSFTAVATSPNEETREPASKELTNGHPSVGGNGTPTITYCDVQAGFDGVGNIELDPLFVDSDNDDFRIAATSPCIDAADIQPYRRVSILISATILALLMILTPKTPAREVRLSWIWSDLPCRFRWGWKYRA